MIIGLYRIFSGYLRVKFYGDFKERALSVCASGGILLWSTKLVEDSIEANITVRDFKYLRILLRGKGVKVHILKKLGMPFVTERYKHRYGILAGALIFFFTLNIMSGYIWIIDVNGNKRLSNKEIISACESIGITEGITKDSFYPKIAREKLMLRLEGVAWCSLNIEGSRLTVNITETKEKDEEKFTYSNLKASNDGIIEKIDVVSGTTMVKVGQAVKRGDLLVSGIVETADGTRFVKSKGSVTAKSQSELVFSEDFKQSPKIPTGKVKTKHVIELFGLKLPLYLGQENGDYDTETQVSTAKLFSSNLPIRLYTKKFTFKRQDRIEYTYEQLTEQLDKALQEELQNKENIRVIKRELLTDEKGVTLKTTVEREKNIAIEDILLINAGN